MIKKHSHIIKILAKKKIKECQIKTYGKNNNEDFLEGDYGKWADWKNILIEFANEIMEKLK